MNFDQTIGENLVHIVDKINTEDMETNTKLMNWSKKKFFTMVCAKISGPIALRQVDISTSLEKEKVLLQNI